MTSLATFLTASAERGPARIAVALDDHRLSYAELDEASARVAALLGSYGVAAGDRVGIMLPNVPQFLIVYYGILRAGAIVVPMNPLLRRREVDYYVSDSGASAVLAWSDLAGEAPDDAIVVDPATFGELLAAHEPAFDIAAREDSDTAVILYTSGTTGTPKGAELTHHNLRRNVQVNVDMIGPPSFQVTLGALPLFHSFGQTCAMNATISQGGMLTLLPRFDPVKALEIVARDRATLFQGVPTMYSAMLHSEGEFDSSSLLTCVSGGASMPVEVMRAFEERFGGVILEGYGLSETSPTASFNRSRTERKPGSIGTPIPGVEMKLADESDGVGEIAIRGHCVMKGYWQRADATAEAIDSDGWFHSGDLAKIDDDGYYFIVDRKKDMIIRGGYNVYPREIEELLYEHPAVREVAVVGVPDDHLGEEVGAAVALKPGTEATPDELRDYVKQRLAAYKYPRAVWLVDELPKGPTGKILKREIAVPELSGH
jgi:long-chain acyl-CoA synthetase